MSDNEDPYAGTAPIASKGRGKKSSAARAPVEDLEPEDLDRFLAGRAQNDIGNAERLCKRYGEDLMYVPGLGWHGWTDLCWSRDRGDDMALQLARQTSKDIWREVAALRKSLDADGGSSVTLDRIDYLSNHAVTSGNMGRLSAMLEAAQPDLRGDMDTLDVDPYLLYTPNDALRLHPSIKLAPRDRAQRVTKLARAAYMLGATCPKWEAFVAQTFPDLGTREFVQRACGYSATGDMSEESFFMCWGKGRNGKGTFLRTVAFVLGTFAATIPVELLLEGAPKTGNEPSPQYAALAGVRFAMTTEPSPGARFNEGELKTLTGRDTIRIRGLYGTPFDLLPRFKLWIACNDRPSVRSASDAYWRRVKLIPFVTNVSESETNRHLEEELRAEASGILNWMLEGVAYWADQGLAPPEAVLIANQSYRDEMDPLQRFLSECTELKPKSEVRRNALYTAYEEWCVNNGEDPIKSKAFGTAMTNKGYRRKHSNGTVYLDLALTETGALMLDKGEQRAASKKGSGW